MLQKLVVALGLMLAMVLLAPAAHAEDGITIRIAKHATLSPSGQLVITAYVTCGPFAGVEDFTEARAGASQARTGAWSEGGLDGTVVCDGVERVHTAHFSSFEDPWKRGPARANVSVITCRSVDDSQQCYTGSAARRVIIGGRRG